MPDSVTPGPHARFRAEALLALVAVLLLCLLSLGSAVAAAAPSPGTVLPASSTVRSYRCDGEPLQATLLGGAVDDPGIPNSSAGTLPGAFVVLRWHDDAGAITLQLPRTNNAGPPSFTDGKWWWSLEDPEHPRFRLRRGRGDVQELACEPA
jgi:hypothetical protein